MPAAGIERGAISGPAPSKPTAWTIDVGAVLARPDRDPVPGRVEGDLRFARVLADHRDPGRRPPGAAGRPRRRPGSPAGCASVRDQTAIASPPGSSATCRALRRSRPPREMSAAGSQGPPAGLPRPGPCSSGCSGASRRRPRSPPGRSRPAARRRSRPRPRGRPAGLQARPPRLGPTPGRCSWRRRSGPRPRPRSPRRVDRDLRVLRRSVRSPRGPAAGSQAPPGGPGGALDDVVGAVVAGPDRDRVAGGVDRHLRFVSAFCPTTERSTARPQAAAGRPARRLDDVRGSRCSATRRRPRRRPGRPRPAAPRRSPACREVGRRRPGAAGRPARGLDDVLGAVVAPPDRDRVAGGVDRDAAVRSALRPAAERSTGGRPASAGGTRGALDDRVGLR